MKILTPEERRTLEITDMRFAELDGMPKRCIILELRTNHGLTGYGEVRDASSKLYALMLKSRILGENPCSFDKLFRRVKQFGGPSRQGGGVSAVETALLDLAGKAWGVPCWQLLGGKFRDAVRMYCDTDVEGKHTGHDMGLALKKRLDMGFTFLKMDLGIGLIIDEPGALTAPVGFLDELRRYAPHSLNAPHGSMDPSQMRRKAYEVNTTAPPFTGVRRAPRGMDLLESYVREAREVVGMDVPIAVDHFGHVHIDDVIRFAHRMEPYNLAWMEDVSPWTYPENYVKFRANANVPVCTGEDIYLKEGFAELFAKNAVDVIHPDIMTSGGMLETKKIGDMAHDAGVAVALHMAGSPVACLASVHVAAALPQVMALEYHSADVPDWNGLTFPRVEIKNGFIAVPDAPGLGIEALDENFVASHLCKNHPAWEETSAWDDEICNDRLWS